ncbi:MAG: 23S rRNA (uridine(2552)-2'-O)-methyltransferase RlmE [Gammaproteobacteria bacterium]|nr:23S rRNA (uridine(2552)-2'-O)-methyltransferase RlmE [Gammaproteobacteria bacterium]MBU1654689.1 23S rRNA (uridine(2552)-2'-O)-methyltransferase RlmE [Gammaproteobacteria bacterium]MBU1961413.1 23S rRNA (uridine(2552)-2'-O)-methyltransferase RlmE [Gammaproteobacteria bacterium]
MAKTKSSQRWLNRHFNDPYVQRAQREGFRSRAAFKLLEIQERDKILRPGQVVVDLGAAPGGWSQVASRLVGGKGAVIAMDILPMDPVADVAIVEGDFREQEALERLRDLLAGRAVDLVISDMAPNVSGVAVVDQPRSIHLCELALEFARETLKPGGDFLVKVFQGEGFEAFLKALRLSFDKVMTRKPEASRSNSREVYLLARGKRV